MYSTEIQLIDQFGSEEISQVSDEGLLVTGAILRALVEGDDMTGYTQDVQDAADLARHQIITAQEMAAGQIDGYLAVIYDLPLSETPKVLTAYSLDITRYRLYDDAAPKEIRLRFEDALRYLRDISLGRAELGIDTAATGSGADLAESNSDEVDRVFTMDTLQDY